LFLPSALIQDWPVRSSEGSRTVGLYHTAFSIAVLMHASQMNHDKRRN